MWLIAPLLHLQVSLFRPFAASPCSPQLRMSASQVPTSHDATTTGETTSSGYVPLSERLPPLDNAGIATRRIFLIRHGETDWNALGKMQGGGFDLELNANGRDQAARLAQELSNIRLDVVASSHLQRARATADAIVQQQQQQCQDSSSSASPARVVLAGLGEMRFGEFEGRALRGPECTKEITEQFQDVNNRMKRDPHVRWPNGGESLAEVEARSVAALNEILELYRDSSRSIGIVAHGRTINIMLASLLEKDCRNFSKYRQRNCCINVLDVSLPSLEYKSVILNYYDHMER